MTRSTTSLTTTLAVLAVVLGSGCGSAQRRDQGSSAGTRFYFPTEWNGLDARRARLKVKTSGSATHGYTIIATDGTLVERVTYKPNTTTDIVPMTPSKRCSAGRPASGQADHQLPKPHASISGNVATVDFTDAFGHVSMSLEAPNKSTTDLAGALQSDITGLITLPATSVNSLLNAPSQHMDLAQHQTNLGAAGTIRLVLRGSVASGLQLMITRTNGTDLIPVSQLSCRPFTPFSGRTSRGTGYYRVLSTDHDQHLRVVINGRATDIRPSYRDQYLRQSWYLITEQEPKGTVDVRIPGGDPTETVNLPRQPAPYFFGATPD